MDRDPDTLTALLLDPFLTVTEAEREAAATARPWPVASTTPVRSKRRPEIEHADAAMICSVPVC